MGVHLTGVYLMGIHFIGVHLIGVFRFPGMAWWFPGAKVLLG
jgi:hypothetical protein